LAVSEAQVRQIKIMISSTVRDLFQYRQTAHEIIDKLRKDNERRLQLVEISMEAETQTGERELAVAISKRWVEEADWIVLIVAWKYGTVSGEDEAAGLSATEWEYRHAREKGKKIFVFLAGDVGDGEGKRYRVTEGEKEDLKDWREEDPARREKIDSFRTVLRSEGTLEIFPNITKFRDRLEQTLRRAVQDLPPDIEPNTPLADIILEVQPHIRDCIKSVHILVNLKRIHDRLHELLQLEMRPIRDEVLTRWEQEGSLSASNDKQLLGFVGKISRRLGAIEELAKSIEDDEAELRGRIDALMSQPDLWTADSADEAISRGEFLDEFDRFSSRVELAFSEADNCLFAAEQELNVEYQTVLTNLKEAGMRRALSEADQERLDVELASIERNRSRVHMTLETHNLWQQFYDQLSYVDETLGTSAFQKQLFKFCEEQVPRLRANLQSEVLEADAPVRTSLEATGTGTAAHRSDAVAESPAAKFAEEDQARECFAMLTARLDELDRERREDSFRALHAPFDDAFFYLDKRTLAEVERALSRVEALERLLGELNKHSRTPLPSTDAGSLRP
jgi:hypothetical protein